MPALVKRRESDLAAPIVAYLTDQGYTVRSEVRNCDITAIKDDALLIVELKTGFSTDLLIQAVERQRVADAVYVALPAVGLLASGKRYDRRRRGIESLLKRLEIGLILVHFPATAHGIPTVEIALHPIQEPNPRRRPKGRAVILREIAGRSADYNVAGTTGIKRLTAYREESIFLAACLAAQGSLSPAALGKLGASKKAGPMLRRNVYGWFDKEARGLYSVKSQAIVEIESSFGHLFERCREKIGGSIAESVDAIV